MSGSAAPGAASRGLKSTGCSLLLALLGLGASVADADVASASLFFPASSCSITRNSRRPLHPIRAFLHSPGVPPAATRHGYRQRQQSPLLRHSSSSSSNLNLADVPTTATSSPAPPSLSWERLSELVEAALASEGDGVRDGEIDRSGSGAVGGVSPADLALVEALEGMKRKAGAEGGEGLRFFNSIRLEPYRASKGDLNLYARMTEKLETCLGFTASPAVERIEAGIAIVMAVTVLTSITSVDKLSGVVPDIVRWFITAGLVSLPFAYISLGLALPDTLIATVNQTLFAVNREYKERVYRHEASHFLVGYLIGLPILRYSVSGRLSAVQFAQVLNIGASTDPQSAAAAAVGPLPRDQAEKMTPRGVLSKQELAKLTVVSLAGVVGEYVRFGRAEGGFTDLVQLQLLLDLADRQMSEKDSQGLINWAVIQAYTMIKQNEKALVELMAALERREGVVECMRIIERLGGRYLDDEDD